MLSCHRAKMPRSSKASLDELSPLVLHICKWAVRNQDKDFKKKDSMDSFALAHAVDDAPKPRPLTKAVRQQEADASAIKPRSSKVYANSSC